MFLPFLNLALRLFILVSFNGGVFVELQSDE